MRPVSQRRRYWVGNVASRLTRRRGAQKWSVSVTASTETGRNRANGLKAVSTTTARVDVETAIAVSPLQGTFRWVALLECSRRQATHDRPLRDDGQDDDRDHHRDPEAADQLPRPAVG